MCNAYTSCRYLKVASSFGTTLNWLPSRYLRREAVTVKCYFSSHIVSEKISLSSRTKDSQRVCHPAVCYNGPSFWQLVLGPQWRVTVGVGINNDNDNNNFIYTEHFGYRKWLLRNCVIYYITCIFGIINVCVFISTFHLHVCSWLCFCMLLRTHKGWNIWQFWHLAGLFLNFLFITIYVLFI